MIEDDWDTVVDNYDLAPLDPGASSAQSASPSK